MGLVTRGGAKLGCPGSGSAATNPPWWPYLGKHSIFGFGELPNLLPYARASSELCVVNYNM
jgi:hypothetical protein